MPSDAPQTDDARERLERVDRIVEDVAVRRAAGESLPDEVVIASHPDLMPELAERLAVLRRVEAGRQNAQDEQIARGGRDTTTSPHDMGTPDSDAPETASSPASAATPSSPPAAVSFPGYHAVCELSRGGQGMVYQAIQEGTKRKVAIKVLREGVHASDVAASASSARSSWSVSSGTRTSLRSFTRGRRRTDNSST